ncbi:MAG: universal stress protein [Candidatus Woesearchaeota archaeon]|nr:universal stress protein [Candidatus Woesearchaeota archaeon]
MKILVPTDGSEYAMKAVNKAVEMAEKEKAEVTLMAVSYSFSLGEDEFPGSILERLDEEAQKALEKAKEVFDKKGISVKTVLERGAVPANNILKKAEAEKFDLIIMGGGGKGEFPGGGIGSTAVKVVSYAPCSVLIVK